MRRAEGRSLGAADRAFEPPISIAVLATLPLALWRASMSSTSCAICSPAVAVERTRLAIEMAVAVARLRRLLRPARLAELPPDAQLSPWTGAGLRLAAAVPAAAFVANRLGFVDLARVLGRRISRAIDWLAAGLWAWVALRFFGVRDAAMAALRRVLDAGVTVGSLDFTVGDVVAFTVTVRLALWVLRILRVLLEDEVLPRARLGCGVPHAISAVAPYAVLLIGFVLAAGAAGFDRSRIALLAGAPSASASASGSRTWSTTSCRG